jgi:hypothetical protein
MAVHLPRTEEDLRAFLKRRLGTKRGEAIAEKILAPEASPLRRIPLEAYEQMLVAISEEGNSQALPRVMRAYLTEAPQRMERFKEWIEAKIAEKEPLVEKVAKKSKRKKG